MNTELVYRWSPKPVEQTLRKGVNQWCLDLPTAQWNIVWLANAKIATEEASAAWREALEESWECRLSTVRVEGMWDHVVEMPLIGWATHPAHMLGYWAKFGVWKPTPALACFDPNWQEVWRKRSRTARGEHPSTLNRMIDFQSPGTYLAQQSLQRLGLVKEFKATH